MGNIHKVKTLNNKREVLLLHNGCRCDGDDAHTEMEKTSLIRGGGGGGRKKMSYVQKQ